MRRTDKETEKEIILKYKEGLSCRTIGNAVGVNPVTVMNILKRNDIIMRTKGGIERLPNDEIKNMYVEQRKTLLEISNHFGVTIETIRLKLIEMNIDRRTMSEHYNPNLNHDYFECIDDEYKAYYLGYLLTDGNIGKPNDANNHPNKCIRFSIHKKDSYIIDEFKKSLGIEEKKRF